MRKASSAEWLLALVMPAEHAATATGDLLELSSTQGSRKFWVSVGRVFAASLVRGLIERPASVFGAALGGFFLQFLLPLPVFFLFTRYFMTHADLFAITALCLTTLTQFLLGRSLATFSAKPAAVCLAIGLLNAIVGACNVNMVSINLAIWQLPVVIGFLMSHRRSHLAAAA
uniref:Uncharacterized protein n=1 Tax=Solibacter usitatus (strain Ellin6076) TaxID=234267 RepID=Q01W24_SOLUE